MSAIIGEEYPVKSVFNDKFDLLHSILPTSLRLERRKRRSFIQRPLRVLFRKVGGGFFLRFNRHNEKFKKRFLCGSYCRTTRLITLTKVLSASSVYLKGNNQEYCHKFIWRGYNPSKNPSDPAPHLFIRPKDQIFLRITSGKNSVTTPN